MAEERPTLTKRELLAWLSGIPDSAEVLFGTGDLTVARVRKLSYIQVRIEFNERYTVEPAKPEPEDAD